MRRACHAGRTRVYGTVSKVAVPRKRAKVRKKEKNKKGKIFTLPYIPLIIFNVSQKEYLSWKVWSRSSLLRLNQTVRERPREPLKSNRMP